MNRRAFLTGAATATLAACGGPSGPPCEPATDKKCPAITPGLPGDDYFAALAADLSAQGFGTPQMIVDLDRLEQNAKTITDGIGASRYRIVEKSLPSIDLLGHVKAVTGSNRFLVLHLPFLPPILDAFTDAEVMIGKSQPLAAVTQMFGSYFPAQQSDVLNRVTFLADGATRAAELAGFAATLPQPMKVAVEIDVGLRRGGVRKPSDLPKVLQVFKDNSPALSFSGFLGYDGHVANAPSPPGLEESAARAALKTATETYQSFVDVLDDFPELKRDGLIFNSGSTSTFPLYTKGPVNDVAAGGGMLRPAAYVNTFISDLVPASFIAAPVLDVYDKLELPFSTNISQTLWSDQKMFTLYGGGWAAELVWPQGVGLAPVVNDAENENLVPNQSWMAAPKSLALSPGDWIFHHPREGDAIFQFEQILLVRGVGKLQPERWRAFPRRY